jgi:hypothetical protein
VLVLSRFAGAARQLSDALLVNPHDPDAMSEAMDTALRMGLAERQERWRRDRYPRLRRLLSVATERYSSRSICDGEFCLLRYLIS